METLNGTSWDVVISGTGLPQSLLALALSRSGKTILHVDRNEYYGGDEAALSLAEAEAWAQKHAAVEDEHVSASFSFARVRRSTCDEQPIKLASSRAYSLALAPQLLYARSALLSSLVSSQTHNQLEFQAVGSWFILDKSASASSTPATLTRVPGGREDVFQDTSLDLKAKRSLMKFLRFVASSRDQPDTWHADSSTIFSNFLQEKFALPPRLHAPIFALSLSNQPVESTTTAFAIPRIERHLTSIGVFGPGFGAVLPKYGGLAELGQVACRACAVGGGIYVLGQGVAQCRFEESRSFSVQLSGGDEVSAEWVVGTQQDLPMSPFSDGVEEAFVSKSISVISSPLAALFPPTCEGGPIPAGAVVMLPSIRDSDPPIYIFAHSSESGECPVGQCVLYAVVAQSCEVGFDRLDEAVKNLIASLGGEPSPQVLWNMQYQQRFGLGSAASVSKNQPILLDSLSSELALDENVLQNVRAAWEQICGTHVNHKSFMNFEPRDGTVDEENLG